MYYTEEKEWLTCQEGEIAVVIVTTEVIQGADLEVILEDLEALITVAAIQAVVVTPTIHL